MPKKTRSVDEKLVKLVEEIKRLPPEHARAFIEGYGDWKKTKEK